MDLFAKHAPEIGELLVSCVTSVQKLIPYFKHLITKISAILEHLDSLENDVKMFTHKLADSKASLTKTSRKATALVERFQNFLRMADLSPGKRMKIIRNARSDDYIGLKNYLEHLQSLFKQCCDCYSGFQGCKEEVSSQCADIVTASDEKKREARRGHAYKRLGSATSSLGSAVQDGSVTLAVASAAGLVAEMGSSMVLGTARACGSAVDRVGKAVSSVGEYYLEIQKAFEELSKDFREMQQRANAVDDNMLKLMDLMENIILDSDNVLKAHTDFDLFEESFDILLDGIRKAKITVNPHEKYMSMTVIAGIFFLWICVFLLITVYVHLYVAMLVLLLGIPTVWYLLFW